MNRPALITHPAEALVLAKVSASVRERLARIKLMVFDVDGILTDGSLWYGEHGEVFKRFNALDGHGLKMLAASGVTVVLMTGLMLYATGKWPTGDGFALVSGIILLLLVTIPGSLLLYSAARKLLSAEVGSPEVTKYARRVVMICGVQFLLILMATLRGLHAAGHLG